MFSEKFRLLKMVALGGIILGLCWYAFWAGPLADPPLGNILSGQLGFPAALTAQYVRIVDQDPANQSMVLRVEGHDFVARFPDWPTAQVGQDISVVGTVTGTDLVAVDTWHLHIARAIKYYVSLPAIFLVVFLLFKKYRFDWEKFEFFEKDRVNSKFTMQNSK